MNALGTREIVNSSPENFMIDHNLRKSSMIKEQSEHNYQSINYNDNYHLLAKPNMQFDFLKEKFLINTDLASESSTPIEDEFDVIKNFIYDNDDEHRDERNLTIDEKLAYEYFAYYESDNVYQLENISEEDENSDKLINNEFQEASDNLIDLYASAISGLSINNNNDKNKIELRKQVQDKVDKYKNRFSQQIDKKSIEHHLELKSKDDYFIDSNFKNQSIENERSKINNSGEFSGNNRLKKNLDVLNIELTRLNEQQNSLINDLPITNQPTDENYETKLAELSDWSIDTIVRKFL